MRDLSEGIGILLLHLYLWIITGLGEGATGAVGMPYSIGNLLFQRLIHGYSDSKRKGK
jgi:hypothetical protein